MVDRIDIRVSKAEKDVIKEQAYMHSLTLSEYVRRRALAKPVRATQVAALRVAFDNAMKDIRRSGTVLDEKAQEFITELRHLLGR